MRIGIDIRLICKQRTGDEAVFFNLVKNLAILNRRGFASTKHDYFLYIDRNPEKNQELKTEIEKLELADNFRVIFVDSPNRFWWNLWALPNYLRKNPIDIFHTQYIAPFWLPKNIKLVLTIHDISFNFFPQFIKFSDLFFLKTLLPRSLKMAAKIISVSDFTKKEIEKYYKIPEEKITAIHNGVDFEYFNREISLDNLDRVGRKYALPENFILYIGTLQPRKNIPALIKSMKILAEKYNSQDLKLVIAGNREAHNFDPQIDEAVKNYNMENSVLFPGWIDEEDKPALYKLSRCFVFPSLYEGFGIPIIEAMAAGVPVVSSDKSCLPEVGKNGVLYADPENPEEFAKKIYEALSDENSRKILKERWPEILKTYAWRKNAEKTLETYSGLEN